MNGGSIFQKLLFSLSLMEKFLCVSSILSVGDVVDVISKTKGSGVRGVVSRWGVTILPRKTRRGRKKVACVGSWHPASLKWTVCRSGQRGFFKRTELRKRVLMLGRRKMGERLFISNSAVDDILSHSTYAFRRYGMISTDFLLLSGSVPGNNFR